MGRARAFALVEVVVVAGLLAVLLAACLPMVQEQRRQASIKADLNSMRLIGQASAMYSSANAGRLFTFSWEPGRVPVTPNAELALACANLNPNNASSQTYAPAIQVLDLVTYGFKDDRIAPIPSNIGPHTPYVVSNHLPLVRFMGESLPSDLFISRGDKHRTFWQNNLDAYLDDPNSSPVKPPTTSTLYNQLWRWAFSSSFTIGPSHYSNDIGSPNFTFPPLTTSRTSTSHRQWVVPNQPGVLGHRNASEVAFPSTKVMMFDDFDRYNAKGRQYFGLETASSIMNFYDGHAARLATADANYGFWPNNPDFGADTPDLPSAIYTYSPISWWDPAGATAMQVPVRYDQTRGGLQGIDFPGMRPSRGAALSGESAR